ncbi:FAD-dependent oxidoreductase [Chloroflexota bacterium]
MSKLTKLFEPIKVGTILIKNRIAMTGFPIVSAEDTSRVGILHQKYIDFFEARAKGGVGLIILPDTIVDRNLKFLSHPCIGGDEFNPGLSALTEAVHTWGAKIAPDLMINGYPQGRDWHPLFPYGSDWRPSSTLPLSYNPEAQTSVDMSLERIQETEDLFADAALRANVTGFDAIHLAGQFGFLIAQFLSPAFNKRTDKYGGSLENRMRFAVELIQKIKDKVGDKLPVIFRLSADEFVDGGLTINDTRIISKKLEQAGVDILNITVGLCPPDRLRGKRYIIIPPMGSPQGPYVDLATQIKEVVDIPVMYAGRVTEPQFAENILEDGKVDMVGMARQLVSDPEWPVKAAEGRLDDIVPCIGCNVCLECLAQKRISKCSVNAALGREKEFRITPAVIPMKVLVVGGGPAGMEAARMAALRGHRVSLYEKEDVLGGQLILSSKAPHKDDIRKFMEYLTCQVEKLDVDIKLGIEVTPEIVRELAPDVVLVATGALPLVPDIPGADGHNVVTAWDVLAGKEVGEKVAIAGGGMVGCETAEYLINKGKRITIVEILPEIAMDVEKFTIRIPMLERFSQYDLKIIVNGNVEAITKKGLVIKHQGDKQVVEADTVILAIGAVPDSSLAEQLRNSTRSVFVIGDCVSCGRIVDAINQASYIALQI